MFNGCYTALVTPFNSDGIDYQGLKQLVDFQIASGVSGIVVTGTTGESPTLDWEEHYRIIQNISQQCKDKCICIAGTGSNNTKETLSATRHAFIEEVDGVLLIDPYYNGPGSLEIRNEYIKPVARSFPDLPIIPYVIPGRTTTQLLPEDLALLYKQYPNVCGVKEATGSFDNMKKTRQLCGPDYTILSGDDDITFTMMTDPDIRANGVVSVLSNIFPEAIQRLTQLIEQGNVKEAETLHQTLKPLFECITIKTIEDTPYGPVAHRSRNPVPCKTLMTLLGLPSGPCRPPMGKLTHRGMDLLLQAVNTVYSTDPALFKPVAEFFKLDIESQLRNTSKIASLMYEAYES